MAFHQHKSLEIQVVSHMLHEASYTFCLISFHLYILLFLSMHWSLQLGFFLHIHKMSSSQMDITYSESYHIQNQVQRDFYLLINFLLLNIVYHFYDSKESLNYVLFVLKYMKIHHKSPLIHRSYMET